MAVAIERGTPLADVLRAQAADVRALGKRQLLESGGRKEIAMMVPVVFIVLPITILFALYPGLLAISSVAAVTTCSDSNRFRCSPFIPDEPMIAPPSRAIDPGGTMNTKIGSARHRLTPSTLTLIAGIRSIADNDRARHGRPRPGRRAGLGDDHRHDGNRRDCPTWRSSSEQVMTAVQNAFESVSGAG